MRSSREHTWGISTQIDLTESADQGAVVQDSIGENRNPEASKLDVRLIDDDPILWARGAAAVAIQRTVLGEFPRPA